MATKKMKWTIMSVVSAIRSLLTNTKAPTSSLNKLITLGNYDWVRPEINEENFPNDDSIDLHEETRLFYFGREISFEEIVAEMAREGWKPATIWHLLVWGVNNPELPRKFPTAALGSSWRGLVPFINHPDILRERLLSLSKIDKNDKNDKKFGNYFRFLAVRK